MQSIQLPVTQIGLEQSIQAAMKRGFSSSKIDLGTNARQISSLSKPLGRITGQADEFTKSMGAANARVLAFGASAGIIAVVSKSFSAMVASTIKVEKSLASINTVLGASAGVLSKFGDSIFEIAKNTGQSFDTVAEGATELARQGLSAAETLKRLNDALILSRLSGLDAEKSVEGLTTAYNSFASSGITTSEILNKLVVVAQKFAVSEKDLIEGLKRSASVANQAGVSMDELVGIITAVQEKTGRGGAVIGQSFKTIFASIQKKSVLEDLKNMGVQVEDLATKKILPATTVLQNLANEFKNLSQVEQGDIAQKLGGVYQLSNLLAGLQDLSGSQSKYQMATKMSQKAQDEAYTKNIALNQTLDSLINRVTVSAEQLGNTLGQIGVSDNLKNLLSFFDSLVEGLNNILQEESGLGNFFRGIAKGVGDIFAGPGLALFAVILAKLSKDLVQFGTDSLKSFFGVGKAVKDVEEIQKSITKSILEDVRLQEKLYALEGDREKQLKAITDQFILQEASIRRAQEYGEQLAPRMFKAGIRPQDDTLRINTPNLDTKNAASGFLPALSKESSDIKKGVGGAKNGDRPVVIPNFNFGGGKKGSIVAHTGEYLVPNFAGKGSAIFNRDMVKSMGMPSGAVKINAARGFVPNFQKPKVGRGSAQGVNDIHPELESDIQNYFSQNPQYASLESEVRRQMVDSYNGGNLTFQKVSDSLAKKAAKESRTNLTEKETIGKIVGSLFIKRSQVEKSAKDSSTLFFDTSEFQFQNGKGIGLIGLSGKSENFPLIEDSNFSADERKILLSQGFISNPDDKITLAFKNLKTSSLQSFQSKSQQDIEKDFREKVNTLFAPNLQVLANDILSSVGGPITDSSTLKDKYLFGNDTLGNIFESAIKLYTTQADKLPTFEKGESERNQAFDFEMSDPDQAKKLNRIFFQEFGGNIGKAEAKKTIGPTERKSIINKSIRNQEVLSAMRKQYSLGGITNAVGGFIPNFAQSITTLYRGLTGRARMSNSSTLKTSNPDLSSTNLDLNLIRDFDSFMRYLAESRNNPLMGVIPTSTSFKRAKGFMDTLEPLPHGEKLKKINFGDEMSDSDNGIRQVMVIDKIKSNRIYKDPEKLKKIFDRLGPEKFSKIASGKLGIDTSLLSKYFLSKGDNKTAELINFYDFEKEVSMLNSLSDKAKLYDVKRDSLYVSSGYIPNFANPLKEAIAREMSAGVPASKIYIDKSPSLKSPMNPMGLMVANRRDEPFGGYQGLRRAKKEGLDPKTYGAAKGFIPNYAAKLPEIANQVEANSMALGQPIKDKINELGKKAIASGGSINAATKNLETYLKSLGQATQNIDLVVGEFKKQASAIKANREAATLSAKAARAQAAEEALNKKNYALNAFLSEEANKKVNKELEKVYLEYQRSQKSSNDLYIAQTKAAKILNKSSLTPDKQKEIIDSTDYLGSHRISPKIEKTNSDYLQNLFLIQAATSGLGGFIGQLGEFGEKTADATSKLIGFGSSFWTILSSMQEHQKSAKDSILESFVIAKKTGDDKQVASSLAELQVSGGLRGGLAKFAEKGGRIGSLASGGLGVISKIAPLFGRVIPVVGLVLTGFQAISALLKTFGFDLEGLVFGSLKKFGQSIGLLASNADKAAKDFQKNRESSVEVLLKGDFSNKASSSTDSFNEIISEIRKKGIEKRLGSSESKNLTDEELQRKDLAKKLEYFTIQGNASILAKNAGIDEKALLEQYGKTGNLQTQVNKLKNGKMGAVKIGATELQKQALVNLENDLMMQYSSKDAREAFLEAQNKKQPLEPFIAKLRESANTNIKEKGLSNQVSDLKDLVLKAGDFSDEKMVLNILEKIVDLKNKANKVDEVESAMRSANLQLLQKQLDDSLAYKQLLFQTVDAQEFSLSIAKDMANLTDAEKLKNESILKSYQLKKQATLDQAKASADIFKNSDALNKALQKVGTEGVTVESFNKIKNLSTSINDLILEQGGYTSYVENKVKDLLVPLRLTDELQKGILATLQQTNGVIKNNINLQQTENKLADARVAIIEGSTYMERERRSSVSLAYDRESRMYEIKKKNSDLDLRAFEIQKEREKIGKNPQESFRIDRELAQKRKQNIDIQASLDFEDSINELRKKFSSAAIELGLNLEEKIKTASKQNDFDNIAKEISNAEKQSKIERIEASIQELDNSKVASEYFYDKIKQAADEFVKAVSPDQKASEVFSGFSKSLKWTSAIGIQEPQTDRRKIIERLKLQSDLLKNYQATSPLSADAQSIFENQANIERVTQQAKDEIDNQLLSSQESLASYGKSISEIFKNISDQISQNRLSLLTSTDSSSIIGSVAESLKISNLQAGPQNESTVSRAEASKAIFLKEIELRKAVSSEDKIAKEQELSQLKDILAFKEEILAADTDEERYKIIDKIIAKEKERVSLGKRLSAVFTSTDEERAIRIEDSLVSASKSFKDNMIDGLINAIDQGGNLSDVLRSSALEFVKTINKANLTNLTDSLFSKSNPTNQSIPSTYASGGRVNGGSGAKDDVPALLMGGEYVINKSAVQKHGVQFFDSINSGKVKGFASGGSVQKGSSFYTPGTFNQGSIQGKRNLLSFAAQTGTSGQFDKIVNSVGYGSISLEPESSRLSSFGMKNSPAFENTQSAKQEAFNLYLQQYKQEQDARKQESEKRKAFRKSLISFAAMAALTQIGGAALAGGRAATSQLGSNAGFWDRAGAFGKGIFKGGQIGDSNVGGLSNLFSGYGNVFSGNFSKGFSQMKLSQIGSLESFNKAIKNADFANAIGAPMKASPVIGSDFQGALNIQREMGISSDVEAYYPQKTLNGGWLSWFKKPMSKISGDRFTSGPFNENGDYIDGWADNSSMWRIKQRATGGIIPPASGVDTVSARLSGGEFVMNRAAVQNIGAANLQSMNGGTSSMLTLDAFNETNEKLIAKLDELIKVSGSNGDININISGTGSETSTQTNKDSSGARQQMAREIKDAVLKIMEDQKRIGGRFRGR